MPIEPGHTQIRQRLGRLELSVLYADLRNFGRASASLEPAKMSEFIKGFAERVSRGTRRHGGHPTRFLGDSAMMLFGLSAAGAITKERLAAQAACEIYELFRYLRSQWDHTPEVSSMGLTFAIATGEVTIGQFGWEGLSAFTAIGDRVNLAGLLARNCRDGELSCCDVTFQRLRRQHPSLRGEERTEVLGELGSRTSYRCRVALLVDDLAIQAAPRTRAVPAP